MTSKKALKITSRSGLNKSKPAIKNTSSSFIINFKDWEKEFIDHLFLYMQIADASSDEYDFDPNDPEIHGKCLEVIVDTIRSCLSSEWKLINKRQNRNDGCIKITVKQFGNIHSSLMKSLNVEIDQFKNSNKKYIVPYIEFFINTINGYFVYWWGRGRHIYDGIQSA